MAAPRQMTSETLNALKGWPSPHAVDYEAKYASDITERVPAGAVVHVDSAGNFALGCDNTTLNPMPLYTFQASDDPDVDNDGGDASTVEGVFVPIAPTGVVMALSAAGAYELVSTNFVAANYAINDKLTSDVGTDPTTGDAGKLKAGTIDTDVICGVVSRKANADGTVDNGYGHKALAFWPWFFPKVT